MLHVLAALAALAAFYFAAGALLVRALRWRRDRIRRRDRATFLAGFPAEVGGPECELAIHDHRRLVFAPFVRAHLEAERSQASRLQAVV